MPRPSILPGLALVCLLAASPSPAHASTHDTAGGNAVQDSTLAPLGIGDWTQLTPAGTLPAPRRQHCMIYDPGHDRLYLYGGAVLNGLLFDTWQFDFLPTPHWTQLQPIAHPTAGSDLVAIYDPIRRRMIVFGGDTGTSDGATNKVWALSMDNPSTWDELHPLGTPPAARSFATGVYDALYDRLIVYGGYPGMSDAWALSLSGQPSWTNLSPGGVLPPGRWGATTTYDPVGNRMVMFGGWSDNSNNTWTLSLGAQPTWTQLPLPGLRPHALLSPCSIYDPADRKMVIYGGLASSVNYPEPWQLTLGNTTPEWSAIPHTSTVPPLRRFHAGAYCSAASQFAVFGGFDDAGQVFRNDLWIMQLSTVNQSPHITSFSPTSGPAGTVVTITGTAFSSATAARFNSTAASYSQISSTVVTAVVPAGATTGPISVETPNGIDVSTTEFFVGATPTLTSINPDSAKVGQTVQILGSNFTGITRVSFGAATAAAFTVVSSTRIDAVVDAGATTGPITVVNPAGTAVSSFAFFLVQANPRPRLLPIHDVALDQGSRVLLRWEASEYDFNGNGTITGYRVWRRAPVHAIRSGGTAAPQRLALRASQATPSRLLTDFWENLAEVPAAQFPGYASVAATLADSTSQGNPWTAFVIQALTANPAVFYFSNVDSGYSVDNLAPALPTQLLAVPRAGGVALHWRASGDADFAAYRIYRGSDAAFTPAPSNLISTRPDTGYFDNTGVTGSVYKLSAVDIHGNASRFAIASIDQPTGTLLSLQSLEIADGVVRLGWLAASLPGSSWTLQRRSLGENWLDRGSVEADASGWVAFEDAGLLAGAAYRYRARGIVQGATYYSPEVAVVLPGAQLALSIQAVSANPVTAARLAFAITLPDAAPARLDLIDVSGRLIESQDLGALGAGRHVVRPSTAIAHRAGIVFARLTQGSHLASTRIALLD